MKKIVLSLLIAFTIFGASAQNSNRKVVIDVTSTDFKVYQSVLLMVKMIAENQPNTQIDVIAYGEAVPMLMKNYALAFLQLRSAIVGDCCWQIAGDEIPRGPLGLRRSSGEQQRHQTNWWRRQQETAEVETEHRPLALGNRTNRFCVASQTSCS